MLELRPFQRRFLTRALAKGVDTAALSIARGNGKSSLVAFVLERCLTPTDRLFEPGAEYLLGAASLEQARNVFRPLRAALEPTGDYRFIDSVTRLGITHKRSNTKLRVMSSNAKAAFGIVGTPIAIMDEPGAWETNGGELMADALRTAQGKPDSRLRLIFVGTLAPSTSGWWHDLIDGGSHGSTYVQALQGDRSTWDSWQTIRKANPLMAVYPESRAKLLEERDAGRLDSRLRARFLSYRLNIPTADESKTLLSTDDWERMETRETPPADGPPIVAVDLGGGRAWSAAVAVWQSGRVEALAVAPGIPDLETQEKRDRVPTGAYRALQALGRLTIAHGLRVQPPAALWDSIRMAWGVPINIVCDRFRVPELMDAIQGAVTVEARMTRWSESTHDIRALRKGVKDGPLVVSGDSRGLVAASLAVAIVKNDDAGNVRMVKRNNNVARDDVAAALCLAAGAFQRAARQPTARPVPMWSSSGTRTAPERSTMGACTSGGPGTGRMALSGVWQGRSTRGRPHPAARTGRPAVPALESSNALSGLPPFQDAGGTVDARTTAVASSGTGD